MTENKMKQILEIEQWEDLKEPEQFLKLMNHFYDLAPSVRLRVVGKIPDINAVAESFKDYCADVMVEYEPSIIVEVANQIDYIISEMKENAGQKKSERKRMLEYLYTDFSEWLGLFSEVRCNIGDLEFVCSVAEAIENALEDSDRDCENFKKLVQLMGEIPGPLKMVFLTEERVEILEAQEAGGLKDPDIDIEAIAELLGDELGIEINAEQKKYIQ